MLRLIELTKSMVPPYLVNVHAANQIGPPRGR
jgi:hypothetical protein